LQTLATDLNDSKDKRTKSALTLFDSQSSKLLEAQERQLGQKSIIKMTEACNEITINEFLYFLSLVDHKYYEIIVSDSCVRKMIALARKLEDMAQQSEREEYFKAQISSGEPIQHKISELISLPLVRKIHDILTDLEIVFDPDELDFNQKYAI
jgi:hypothetical protein